VTSALVATSCSHRGCMGVMPCVMSTRCVLELIPGGLTTCVTHAPTGTLQPQLERSSTTRVATWLLWSSTITNSWSETSA